MISDYLKSSGLTQTTGFKRLVIEKPFGSDLKSAESLNNQIRRSFRLRRRNLSDRSLSWQRYGAKYRSFAIRKRDV